MLTRDMFERVAEGTATAMMSYAAEGFGPDEPASEAASVNALVTAEGFEEEALELAKAFDRLAVDPSIRSPEHNGVFSYEDPILANAALQAREEATALGPTHAFMPGEELTSNARWMLMGVRSYLSRHRYDPLLVNLAGRTPAEPLKIAKERFRLAVIGDAGQVGYAQDRVIQMMQKGSAQRPFDAVVHLGDVYFAAGIKQMTRNFLRPFMPLQGPKCPLFTLCGNHDLYYGAEAYYTALEILKQPGRYFAIENDHWRIACLDTSLGAVSLLRNDGALDDSQRHWLDELLAKEDGKRLVLLSHHFIVSGWDSPAATLKNHLQDEVKGRVFAWYWGHEHRAATYERGTHGFYGASLGNGVFPDVWSEPSKEPEPSWYSTSRCSCFGKSNFWPHGYAELEFHPDRIVEVIYLENGERAERVLTDAGSTRPKVA